RRNGASASGGHGSTAAGHHANSSCSESGVTDAPSASHAMPISSTTWLGTATSASTLRRSARTDHSSSSSRPRVSVGFSSTSSEPPAPSAQRPAQEASHPARRPASQRPSAARTTPSPDRPAAHLVQLAVGGIDRALGGRERVLTPGDVDLGGLPGTTGEEAGRDRHGYT